MAAAETASHGMSGVVFDPTLADIRLEKLTGNSWPISALQLTQSLFVSARPPRFPAA
jgi:hypothetical protein